MSLVYCFSNLYSRLNPEGVNKHSLLTLLLTWLVVQVNHNIKNFIKNKCKNFLGDGIVTK